MVVILPEFQSLFEQIPIISKLILKSVFWECTLFTIVRTKGEVPIENYKAEF